MEQNATSNRESLPVILAAAVVQGGALFGLHHAITTRTWPATDLAWLLALYSVVVLIPVTVQLLAGQMRGQAAAAIVALMTVAVFYFGWHHGSAVADFRDNHFAESGECFPLAIVLIVLWLLVMPFVQARLKMGRWTADYLPLFDYAWRNAITLAEAGVFTGLFWLLLFLWQSLFHMLHIDFFRELFREPIFVYPVTSLVVGCALHLIGSVERFVSTVLEQILNVFKWLGTVSGLLLALFTLALIFRLPSLIFTGEKAIGASWLLWLVAVVVLFLNAACRDGSVSKPYPRWIAFSLRIVIPLTVIVALTATYALSLRTREYGLTVERFWGFIVAAAALIYSMGYSLAAIGEGAWFAGISRVNVIAALALIGALGLALTPVLSPYRLSAVSQYTLVMEGRFKPVDDRHRGGSPFHYLRFASGAYGRHKLAELAQLQNHPDAPRIRELASAEQRLTNPWETVPQEPAANALAKMVIYPPGRTLDAELSQRLRADLDDPKRRYMWASAADAPIAGLFVALSTDGSGSEEFVLLNGANGVVYRKDTRAWREIGLANGAPSAVTQKSLLAELARGNVSVKDPAWKELWVGSHRIRVQ
jgi:hypothetical protein